MTQASDVLLVDDDPDLLKLISLRLTSAGYRVRTADSGETALAALAVQRPAAVITDLKMPGIDGLALFDAIHRQHPAMPVIILTAHGTIPEAVSATQRGVFGFLTKPFDSQELLQKVAAAVRLSGGEPEPTLQSTGEWRAGIITRSPRMEDLMRQARLVADSDASVLIFGESGTGKELLARAIHAQSDRREGPFIRMNCAALPEGQIESALFGHEKGALMGSPKRSLGALERANGGTLLLDEIAELRPDLQPKLLRVLQEREFERIGGSGPVKADVRIIATTSRDLEAEVSAGRFRQDLYYRLNVFPISIPALRERREDIPVLAHRFAARAAAEAGKEIEGFEADALELLCGHDWPGNVRQLQNAVERAVILSTDSTLRVHLFASLTATAPLEEVAPSPSTQGAVAGAPTTNNSAHVLALPSLDLMEVERRVIEQALALTKGNRTRAAQMLGINVRTLRRKLNGGGDSGDDTEVRGRVA